MTSSKQRLVIDANVIVSAVLSAQGKSRQAFNAIVEFVEITEQINECRDVKDDKYLELAVNGEADLILTGDDDLLVLHPFRQIPIVRVQTFLESME